MFTKIEPESADQGAGHDLEPRGPEPLADFLEKDTLETTDVDEILRKLHREGVPHSPWWSNKPSCRPVVS